MPSFSNRSKQELITCDEKLQQLFEEVIKYYDCTILHGFRDKETQNELFRQGKSKLEFPDSKHNKFPSLAVDVAPYKQGVGIDWNDREQFYHFVGFVKGVASQLGINIRCGADWDGDNDFDDQSFDDLPHFELV